jgi:Family of unknown function (DUF6941)
MPRIEWALLCDLAYFDAYRNLCVIGVQTQPVPSFPIGTRRFAIAARVPGLTSAPSITVSVSTPDAAAIPNECEDVRVDVVGDHLLVSIGVSPLIDDGVYRFEVALQSQPPITIDLPLVIAAQQPPPHPLAGGHHLPALGAVLPPGGVDHVGLG